MTEAEWSQLQAGLRALNQAPPCPHDPDREAALVAAFRQHHARRRRSHLGWFGAVAACLALLAVRGTVPSAQPMPPLVARTVPPSAPALTAEVVSVPRGSPQRKPRRPARAARPPQPPVASPPEVATQFFPVWGADSREPLDRGRLIRVSMPRAALTSFGLPVNESRLREQVKADLLLGEDGIAQAIRFVQ